MSLCPLSALHIARMILAISLALAAPAAGQPYERQVASIPVSRGGAPIPEPWTGGIWSPRPLLADLDDDDDLDLLIVQKGGSITHYRNEGTPQGFDFRFATDNLQGIDARSWATLADIDADGDLDLFTDGDDLVAFHRNDGTPQAPLWVLVDPAFHGIVNTGLGNTPSFVDVDVDGDLDYLEMEQTFGTARLYRNDGSPQTPSFVFVTDEFGCIDTLVRFGPGAPDGASSTEPSAASYATGEPRHGISVISPVDIDDDSDLDVFIGDLFNLNLWFFRNDNPGPDVCYVNVTAEFMPISTTGLNHAEFGDLDGDLDLDLLVGVANQSGRIDNLIYMRNDGTPAAANFVVQTMNAIPAIDVAIESRPASGDLDGDGDLDLFLGAHDGTVLELLNVGTPLGPSYVWGSVLRDAFDADIDVGFSASPEIVDYEGDGDLDLFIGQGSPGRVVFFRNDGTPQEASFHLADSQFTGVQGDFNAVPTLGDLDDDGDLDMLLGEFGISLNARIFYMRNDGTIEAPAWVEVSDNTSSTFIFAERVFQSSTAPELFDIDEDGDLDLFVGEGDGNINFYRNDGTPQVFDFVLVDEEFAGAQVGLDSGPLLADLDFDQDADLLIGEKNGGVNLYRNLAIVIGVAEPPTTTPVRTRLGRARPNPANPATTIRFALAAPGRVKLTIHAVSGRLVRTLLDRALEPAASIDVAWDGRDDRGRGVSSGVFFYRLDTPGHRSARKLVILK